MTEREAWLELARMFEPETRRPRWPNTDLPLYGIRQATAVLKERRTITIRMELLLDDKLRRFFQPTRYVTFYWPRLDRASRATACGLLAAMTQPGKPS